MNLKSLSVSVCLCLCLSVAHVSAQMSQEELRRERVETIEELRRTEDVSGGSNFLWRGLSNATGWEVDYGGWYAPTFTSGDNNTDRSSAAQDAIDHTWDHELQLFTRIASGTKRTKFYSRLKTTSTKNSRSVQSVDRSDQVQPTFDMFYLEHSRQGRTFKHTWTFGRQFAQVERGIGFGMTADGLRYELASRRNEVQAFFLTQSPGDNNVDASAVGWNAGRTKRWFFGAEWKWKIHPKFLKLDLSLLNNMDRNFAFADANAQKHQLDSIFYGLGLSGNLTGRLSYWTQYIMETGKTYASAGGAAASTISLDANAIDLGLKYFFPTSFSPTLYTEYASGSGDGDAFVSATTTAGGSTAGKDERFISFGGLSLGYALAPQLINIKVLKLGGSVKPFGWSSNRLWTEILLQPTWYSYTKDKAAGITSDAAINSGAGSSKKIGSEFDFTLAWRLSGDLKYQLKWGRFSPGAAYNNRSSETYWKLKLSLDL